MFHAFILAALVAVTPSTSPTPTPTPTASPTPTPPYSLHGAFSGYSEHTNNVNPSGALDTPNGVDLASRTDVSNALLTLSKNTTQLQGSVTVGAYAFPVVGTAINPTTQQHANSYLYGFVPAYDLAYVPNGNVTVSAGQLATLLGQENGFTFQNYDIQRGLVWAAEPTFSRGVRVAYANGKISGDLEYDDGYYSGSTGRAVEGLAGWAPTANTNWSFAFIVPGANTPPNVTAAIANKREYDFMLTQTFGKLSLEPYVLYIQSPSSAALGYTNSESAVGGVILAQYAWNSIYSVSGRFESFANHSATSDASPNADLVGYGPGSRATTWTITPAYHPGPFFLRAEYSLVTVFDATAGFGPSGSLTNQSRYLLEMGVQF
ncbi:MAG TPA: outer membrane beta-barrel protein [Candidatus Acidoferrum sp.]|nr:outer membrane beta-barrel protein [Candidatus Acidoferrum sp.]